MHFARDKNAQTLSALAAALLTGDSLELRVRGATLRAFRDAECATATWVCEVDGLVHTSGDPFDVAVAFVTAREDLARSTLPAPRPKFPALRDVPTEPLPSR